MQKVKEDHKKLWQTSFLGLFLVIAIFSILYKPNKSSAATPNVFTSAASSVSQTSATLNGYILDTTGDDILSIGFNYGLTASYGQTVSGTSAYVLTDAYSGFTLNNPIRLDFDSSGYLYVIDQSDQKIKKYDPDGNLVDEFTVDFSTYGIMTDIAIRPSDDYMIVVTGDNLILTIDTTGAVVDQFTGNSGNLAIEIDTSDNVYLVRSSIVEKYDSDGNFIQNIGSGGNGPGQFGVIFNIFIGAGDIIYVADSNNNRIEAFDTSGTFLYESGTAGSGPGEFNDPRFVSEDVNGNFYVVDFGNTRVQKFDSNWNFITQYPLGSTYSTDIVVDQTGAIFITNSNGQSVNKYNYGFYASVSGLTCATTYHFRAFAENDEGVSNGLDDTFTTSACPPPPPPASFLAITGAASGITDTEATLAGIHSGSDAVVSLTRGFEYGKTISYGQTVSESGSLFYYKVTGLSYPFNIGINHAGDIYVVDIGDNFIKKFDADGNFISQFGGSGTGDGQFSSPYGIAFDSTDNIYISDPSLDRVQKFNSAGVYQSQFGSTGSGDGELSSPQGIGVDSSGNIFVSDAGNNRVQKFNSSGVYVSQFGDMGTDPGQFSSPYGIDIDENDSIYVVDTGNSRIQKFNSSFTPVLVFGDVGNSAGQFSFPVGISVSSSGKIYIADTGNSRIQIFDASGNYVSGFGEVGVADGQIFSPYGVVVDDEENIYVSDADLTRYQKFNENFSLSLSGLDCGTEYHYRAFADDSSDTEYGDDDTFETDACASVPSSPGGSGSGGSSSGYMPQPNPKPETGLEDGGKSCPVFKGYARFGSSKNDPNEVRKIQDFLNSHMNFMLTVDGVFGKKTDWAVRLFQDRYYEDVVKPWRSVTGLKGNSGWWFKTTSAEANKILGCDVGRIELTI